MMDNTYLEDIKWNCDISDAQYWGYFSICGLLLRYRDLYRSEQGLKPWANISRSDIAAWIEKKEARWPELEQQEFRDIVIAGKTFRPFDVDAINDALRQQGLVYGAGYGMYLKPTFFLAELRSTREVSGLTVHVSGRELVRDLLTAPAMLQESTVFLRLEPLSILLHYKFSELNAKQNAALEDAFSRYGFLHRQLMDTTFEKRMEDLANRYAEIILCHEIGEHAESIPQWKEILSAAGDRKNEHYLRAVKDLIADTSEQGPIKKIIDTKDRGALGLSIALTEGFQRVLFPELRKAYAVFLKDGNWESIEKTRRTGHERFVAERESIVETFRVSGKEGFARQLKITLPT